MIKVAFVINTIYSPTGGTEKQLLLLLKNLDRNRFSPVLCVVQSSDWLEKEFDLCPLYNMGINSYRSPVTLGRFWKFVGFLKSERIDIVHTLFKDGMRLGIPAAKLAGVPKIIAVRRSQGYWMTPLDMKITKVLNRWVDLILANSHDTRQWTTKVEGFPLEKIQVIHNGIDLDPFASLPSDTRQRYRSQLGIPNDAPVAGIVANLRPVKAIDTFIRAAHLVTSALPSAWFVIVGDGDLDEDLRVLAMDLGVGERVLFLGRRTDIIPILSTFDVGVLTSTSESFSNAIVEYLAAGLPVVCTEVGGAREAVEEGDNGHVVPVGDYAQLAKRLIEVLKDERGKVMGEVSRRKALNLFSFQAMLKRYEDVYSFVTR
jgi:glycosyltransferase involved in cell wall biosynthesis